MLRAGLPSVGDRRALAGAAALSVALHGVLAWQLLGADDGSPVVANSQRPMMMTGAILKDGGAGSAVIGVSRTAPVGHAGPAARSALDRTGPKTDGAQAPAVASVDAAPEDADAQPAATLPEGDDGYIPRPLLTRAPVALGPVQIIAPESNAPMGTYVGVLSLFIDEQGGVREARADSGSDLPPEMIQAAREAFMQARFSPGEVDGRAVRSRLRVEVMFDHLPRVSGVGAAADGSADDGH